MLAFKSLKKRKIRTFLTILGIFLGILTIFVLMSLSLGLREYVNEQFESLGTDKFFIQPKGQSGAPGSSGGAVQLTEDDVEVVEKISGVETVAYFGIGNVKIEFDDKARYYMLMGMPLENIKTVNILFESFGIGIDEGRMLKKGDRKKVLVGYNYRYKNLYDKPVRVGSKLMLNGEEFEVVGVLESIGNPQDDQQLYINQEDFKDLFNSGNRVDYMIVQTKKGADLKKVAEETERKLMRFRDVDEKSIDFTIQTPEELLGTFGNVLDGITWFLFMIAFISAVVGGIGIANTMYTSVLERTRDIGTMKAIGAKNIDILYIFVIEASILGLIGSVLGVVIGIIIAKAIEYIIVVYVGSNLLRASTNYLLITLSLSFGFLVGALSGLLPSLQASKIKPADTLRYE
ncbi:MAG: ABC transporter permease [Candidatus Pacearchaeota archaeon]